MAAEADTTAARGRRFNALWVVLAVVLAWAGLRLLATPPALAPVRCAEDRAVTEDTVVMLSASWCGYCRRARAWMQSEGIAHCEYDVETTTEGRRQFAALPVKVVPVIRVRDDTLFGFNRTEIEQAMVAHGLREF